MIISETCRVANLNDVDKTVEIIREFFEGSPLSHGWPYDAVRVRAILEKAIISPKTFIVLLSVQGDDVVGVIAGRVDDSVWTSEKCGIEMAWYVKPEFRKSGRRAAELLTAFKTWAKVVGAGYVYYGMMAEKQETRLDERKIKSIETNTVEKL